MPNLINGGNGHTWHDHMQKPYTSYKVVANKMLVTSWLSLMIFV